MGPEITPGDFEQLKVWQMASELIEIIHATISAGHFRKDRPFSTKLQRADISIASNIAEGFVRYSDKEFMRYLSITNGSTYEVRCQIKLAQRINYIGQKESQDIVEGCQEISRIIEGLRKAVARRVKD